ncbi:MAG: methylmalonyl Co-A mutase-associated GTPase MeaB [Deltaproteobacteria bacterium]|nr:methylmalonyl Co-A mutase-associated GTPase MeaB [Deltaproteobacteria bacterium]
MDIVAKIKAGDVRSIARLITLVERRDPEAVEVIKKIYSGCGNARVVGITGPPGVGKSCLVAAIVKKLRQKKLSVGVLAVDPSSSFSGGALLGDRVRMIDLSGDKEVFIRSLASRGALGGLSAAVNDAVDILDVSGKDIIIIETVGVGQGEIDIAALAHTVLLVLMPGYGDTLQAMKAGIMEIADILVVNKADKPGADQTVADLASVQNLSYAHVTDEIWYGPVIKTSALSGEGVDELVSAIFEHAKYLEKNKISAGNSERRKKQFLDLLTQQIRAEFKKSLEIDPSLRSWIKKIENLELPPYTAAEQVIGMIRKARERVNDLNATGLFVDGF